MPSGTNAAAILLPEVDDEVLVLSTSTGQVLRYPKDLSTSPTIQTLPTVIAPTGGVDMDVTPDGQEVWISDAAGGAIYRLTDDTSGSLIVSETIPCCGVGPSPKASGIPIENPEKISISDNGYPVVLTTSGTLLELEPSPAGGWQPSTNPVFSGYSASGFIDIVRSRTNYDAATMSGPSWRNVLPLDDFGEGPPIPTVSTWGLAVFSLLILVVGTSCIAAQRSIRRRLERAATS